MKSSLSIQSSAFTTLLLLAGANTDCSVEKEGICLTLLGCRLTSFSRAGSLSFSCREDLAGTAAREKSYDFAQESIGNSQKL